MPLYYVKAGYACLGHLFQILNEELGSLYSQLREVGISRVDLRRAADSAYLKWSVLSIRQCPRLFPILNICNAQTHDFASDHLQESRDLLDSFKGPISCVCHCLNEI